MYEESSQDESSFSYFAFTLNYVKRTCDTLLTTATSLVVQDQEATQSEQAIDFESSSVSTNDASKIDIFEVANWCQESFELIHVEDDDTNDENNTNNNDDMEQISIVNDHFY